MRNMTTDGEGFLAHGSSKKLTGCKSCSVTSPVFVDESSLMDDDTFFSRIGTYDCLTVFISNGYTSNYYDNYNFQYVYNRPSSPYDLADAKSIYNYEFQTENIKMYLYLGYDLDYIPWRRLRIWKDDILVYDVKFADTTGYYFPYISHSTLADITSNIKTTYVAWDEINPAKDFGVNAGVGLAVSEQIFLYFGKIRNIKATISGTSMSDFYFAADGIDGNWTIDGYFTQSTIDGVYDGKVIGSGYNYPAYIDGDEDFYHTFSCSQRFSGGYFNCYDPYPGGLNGVAGAYVSIQNGGHDVTLNAQFYTDARDGYSALLNMFFLYNHYIYFGSVKVSQINNFEIDNDNDSLITNWDTNDGKTLINLPCYGSQYSYWKGNWDGVATLKVLMGGTITFHLIPEGMIL